MTAATPIVVSAPAAVTDARPSPSPATATPPIRAIPALHERRRDTIRDTIGPQSQYGLVPDLLSIVYHYLGNSTATLYVIGAPPGRDFPVPAVDRTEKEAHRYHAESSRATIGGLFASREGGGGSGSGFQEMKLLFPASALGAPEPPLWAVYERTTNKASPLPSAFVIASTGAGNYAVYQLSPLLPLPLAATAPAPKLIPLGRLRMNRIGTGVYVLPSQTCVIDNYLFGVHTSAGSAWHDVAQAESAEAGPVIRASLLTVGRPWNSVTGYGGMHTGNVCAIAMWRRDHSTAPISEKSTLKPGKWLFAYTTRNELLFGSTEAMKHEVRSRSEYHSVATFYDRYVPAKPEHASATALKLSSRIDFDRPLEPASWSEPVALAVQQKILDYSDRFVLRSPADTARRWRMDGVDIGPLPVVEPGSVLDALRPRLFHFDPGSGVCAVVVKDVLYMMGVPVMGMNLPPRRNATGTGTGGDGADRSRQLFAFPLAELELDPEAIKSGGGLELVALRRCAPPPVRAGDRGHSLIGCKVDNQLYLLGGYSGPVLAADAPPPLPLSAETPSPVAPQRSIPPAPIYCYDVASNTWSPMDNDACCVGGVFRSAIAVPRID